MQATQTAIPDVWLLKPRIFEDSRGFFAETYNQKVFAEAGLPCRFVQDSLSRSRRNVLRGLHYQIRQPQGRLVRAVFGEVFDVCVDIRRGSPTFGKWVSERLSSESLNALWIPPGFAHGFLVLSEWAELEYKATDFYAPQHERTIRWNDPDLAIHWPLVGPPEISGKDAKGIPFREAEIYTDSPVAPMASRSSG